MKNFKTLKIYFETVLIEFKINYNILFKLKIRLLLFVLQIIYFSNKIAKVKKKK